MPEKKKPGRASPNVIQRQLLKARSIMLFGPIEPKRTQEVITQLLVLNQINQEKPIRMFINSPGGVADDGFAIYDVMRFIEAPVQTIVSGLAASAATIVMVGTPKEHRYVLENSRIMLHQPSSGGRGTASDIAITAQELIRLRKKANELFVRETGQPLEKIEQDMHRDFWLSAQEAVDYGLLAKVIKNESELG